MNNQVGRITHPKSLLTSNRLDLIFKLLYLEKRNVVPFHAKEIYLSHIDAFTLGRFVEPGNETKNSPVKFLEEFEKIANSIEKYDFNSKLSMVPIASNGTILNGSHRVAASIYLEKNVVILETDKVSVKYDYEFFRSRGVDEAYLDEVVTKYVSVTNGNFIAIIWPKCNVNEKTIKKYFKNLTAYKEIELDFEEFHKLIIHIYREQMWIGDSQNGYAGAKNKANLCYAENNPIKVIVFQEQSLEIVNSLKIKFRDEMKLGKSSIHITDDKLDTEVLANLFFNLNTISFIKEARFDFWDNSIKKINEIKKFIKQNNWDVDKLVVGGGTVLESYGIRKSQDIDYISVLGTNSNDTGWIQSHHKELKYHAEDLNTLIFNPINYYSFYGVKLLTLKQVMKMKNNRAELKDIKDIELIEKMINFQSKNKEKIFRRYIYFKHKIRNQCEKMIIRVMIILKVEQKMLKFYQKYLKN
jgi:hypothetical protein